VSLVHDDEFASDASFSEDLVGASCLSERQALGNERFDRSRASVPGGLTTIQWRNDQN
jgi:hypothetical protein